MTLHCAAEHFLPRPRLPAGGRGGAKGRKCAFPEGLGGEGGGEEGSIAGLVLERLRDERQE